MGEATKKISFASLEDQSRLTKPNAVKPFSFMAPTKLFAGAGSSSQVWQKPFVKSLGNAEGSTNPGLDLQLAISNTFSAEAADNHNKTMENPTLDQAEKNHVNGSFATPGAVHNANKSQTYDGQARQPGFDLNLAPEMEDDPRRLRRLIANRVYSERHRLKKTHYVANLEKLSSSLMRKVANIRAQIEESKNKNRSMLMEHHTLKFRMAALEKNRLLTEAEIEKSRAEVNRLKELQKKQSQVKEHAMQNSGAGLHATKAQFDLNSL